MAIADAKKVDYLWKKIGYGATKTDTNANKAACRLVGVGVCFCSTITYLLPKVVYFFCICYRHYSATPTDSAVTLSPEFNFNLTNTTFPVAFAVLSVPRVNVNCSLE